jgi:hypothetical protein
MPLLGFLSPSILWAIGGAALALLISIGTWALHTPSKVTLAVNAAHADGEVKRLRDANAQMAAAMAEEQKAARLANARAAAKEAEHRTVSARVKELEAENAELTKPRPDDATPLFDPLDPWLQRRSKAGSTAHDPRSKNR